MFSYHSKALFSGFLRFKGNFVDGRNNSKYRDVAPLTLELFCKVVAHFLALALSRASIEPDQFNSIIYSQYKGHLHAFYNYGKVMKIDGTFLTWLPHILSLVPIREIVTLNNVVKFYIGLFEEISKIRSGSWCREDVTWQNTCLSHNLEFTHFVSSYFCTRVCHFVGCCNLNIFKLCRHLLTIFTIFYYWTSHVSRLHV